jgi:hypothetical protein
MRRGLIGVIGLVVLACTDVIGPPFFGDSLPRSAQTLPGVNLSVTADHVVVEPGDSLRFTATAVNRSNVRVQLGQACGPMMDVAVVAPTGREQSALVGNRTDVAFDCPLPLSFFADPGESRTIQIGWQAPRLRGTYTARAGLRRNDGLGNESPRLIIEVR